MPINVGDVAPDFAATSLDGKEIRLADLRGKVVLLDFWATWCGPCLAELPNLRREYDEHTADGRFVILGVSFDDAPETVRKFVKEKNVPWGQIAAGPAEVNPIAKLYRVSGVPAMFLVGPDGRVVAKDLTGVALHDELARILASKPQAKGE